MTLVNLYSEGLLYLFSYFCGSIPFGLLITRCFAKKDIRSFGSGNIGATNAFRTGGKLVGALTLILDMLKCILPLYITKHYIEGALEATIYICGTAAVVGHMFPLWLKFNGGKGVASAAAMILFIKPILLLSAAPLFAFLLFATKIMSLSSIALFGMVFFVSMFLGDATLCLVTFVLFIMIVCRHKENILRIYNGTENKIFSIQK